MAATKSMGANPFTQAEVDQMLNLANIAGEVSAFLARCQNCGLSVGHLQQQVSAVSDMMTALYKEFSIDPQP